jgi:hypothetical protein
MGDPIPEGPEKEAREGHKELWAHHGRCRRGSGGAQIAISMRAKGADLAVSAERLNILACPYYPPVSFKSDDYKRAVSVPAVGVNTLVPTCQ